LIKIEPACAHRSRHAFHMLANNGLLRAKLEWVGNEAHAQSL
jgi:hypothetical protein